MTFHDNSVAAKGYTMRRHVETDLCLERTANALSRAGAHNMRKK